MKKKDVVILISVLSLFLLKSIFYTVLRMNYLLPWQIPLFKDRRAIIKYAREVHPGAKIVEEHMEFVPSGYFTVRPDCYIMFEEDGFQYSVSAHDGKVSLDFYKPAKLTNEVRLFIKENFFDPRGIENVKIFCDFGFKEYEDAVPEQWSEYNDDYTVKLHIYEQGATPYDVGWIYDFYRFWDESTIFPPNWYLSFAILDKADDYPNGNLYASYKSDFSSEDDWYKWFH